MKIFILYNILACGDDFVFSRLNTQIKSSQAKPY